MQHRRAVMERPDKLKDRLEPKGRVEIFVSRGAPQHRFSEQLPSRPGTLPRYRSHEFDFSQCDLISTQDVHNIIVNHGKDSIIETLATGDFFPIIRMAIGDRGTIPSDSQVPKVALPTQEELFSEVYRDDVEAYILDVGTPDAHEVRFVKTFSSLLIPITAFTNQAVPVVNEVGLITGDTAVTPLPRAPVASPNAPLADERLFSIRTFKSVPFEAANEIAVTIRYTIYIE